MTERNEVLKNECGNYPNGFEFALFLSDKFIKETINSSRRKAERAFSSFDNYFTLFNR